jgi:hypothetical protein
MGPLENVRYITLEVLNRLPEAAGYTLIIVGNDARVTRFARGDFATLVERVRRITRRDSESTALWDGFRSYLGAVTEQPGRHALVVFTDGRDTASTATFQHVLRAFPRLSGDGLQRRLWRSQGQRARTAVAANLRGNRRRTDVSPTHGTRWTTCIGGSSARFDHSTASATSRRTHDRTAAGATSRSAWSAPSTSDCAFARERVLRGDGCEGLTFSRHCYPTVIRSLIHVHLPGR